nr:MAG TPA: hypothetical protein [Caudoviricetes sp.]
MTFWRPKQKEPPVGSPVIRIYFFKSSDIIALPELNHQVSNFCMSP